MFGCVRILVRVAVGSEEKACEIVRLEQVVWHLLKGPDIVERGLRQLHFGRGRAPSPKELVAHGIEV